MFIVSINKKLDGDCLKYMKNNILTAENSLNNAKKFLLKIFNKLYILQKIFKFTHGDFKLDNVLYSSKVSTQNPSVDEVEPLLADFGNSELTINNYRYKGNPQFVNYNTSDNITYYFGKDYVYFLVNAMGEILEYAIVNDENIEIKNNCYKFIHFIYQLMFTKMQANKEKFSNLFGFDIQNYNEQEFIHKIFEIQTKYKNYKTYTKQKTDAEGIVKQYGSVVAVSEEEKNQALQIIQEMNTKLEQLGHNTTRAFMSSNIFKNEYDFNEFTFENIRISFSESSKDSFIDTNKMYYKKYLKYKNKYNNMIEFKKNQYGGMFDFLGWGKQDHPVKNTAPFISEEIPHPVRAIEPAIQINQKYLTVFDSKNIELFTSKIKKELNSEILSKNERDVREKINILCDIFKYIIDLDSFQGMIENIVSSKVFVKLNYNIAINTVKCKYTEKYDIIMPHSNNQASQIEYKIIPPSANKIEYYVFIITTYGYKFIKALNNLEYGTAHLHTINDNFEKIIIAGEMSCSNLQIKFNFLSGTFTKPIKDMDSENFNNITHIYIYLCKLVIGYALLNQNNTLNIEIIYTTDELFSKMSNNIENSIKTICDSDSNTKNLTYKIPHSKDTERSCFKNSITAVQDIGTQKLYTDIKKQIENKINNNPIDEAYEQYLACKK
jgi:hypothetical protein